MLIPLLLVGRAWAFPGPVLGPDGPMHVGPLTPEAHDPRGVVLVDPVDGGLGLRLPAALGTLQWFEGRWSSAGRPIDGPDPRDDAGPIPADTGSGAVPEGPRWTWSAGQLTAFLDPEGGPVRVSLDAEGRPRRLEWADASALDLRYDAFGRVIAATGPGSLRQTYTWRDGTLDLVDAQGSPVSIRRRAGLPFRLDEASEGSAYTLEVSDALGRIGRSYFARDPQGQDRLLAWEDPRGLRTSLERGARALTVRDPSGRDWRVDQDEAGRVLAVQEAGLGRWVWRHSGSGQLRGIEDPAGRVHGWAEDAQGRVESAGRGSAPWRLRRDPQGRVSEILDPAGAITRLERDGRGLVVRIVDALGNVTAIDRRASGQPSRIRHPDLGEWTLEADVMGRVRRIVRPDDRRLDLRRDLSGRLVGLDEAGLGSVALDRDSQGRITRVRASAGPVVELRRDLVGRLESLRSGEGWELRLRRDPLGDVVELVQAGGSVAVLRDTAGRALRAGAVTWRRGLDDRVSGIDAPARQLELRRDAAGLLLGVQAGSWVVALQRDASGRVQRWEGTDGTVEVQRGPGGRIERERVLLADERWASALPGGPPPPAPASPLPPSPPVPDLAGLEAWLSPELRARLAPASTGPASSLADATGPDLGRGPGPDESVDSGPSPAFELRLQWDMAGRISKLSRETALLEWRMLRDGAGRLLRLLGPGGLAVGIDRDDAGLVDLLRLPRGALVRRLRSGAREILTLVGTDGRDLETLARSWDQLGRRVDDHDPVWGPRTWRYDPAGRLALIEGSSGRAWSWTPGGWTGPEGEQVELDVSGRPRQARPPAGPPAWGVGSHTLAWAWEDDGTLRWVAGELGATRLGLDALGRLLELQPEVEAPWHLRYDARGRLAQVERGGVTQHRLSWGPDPGTGRAALLVSGPGGQDAWVDGPWGPLGVLQADGVHEVLHEPGGTPWWVMDASGGSSRASVDLRGYPQVTRGGGSVELPAAGGALQLFPGGPLLVRAPAEGGLVPAGVAVDPVSGGRVDGLSPWPWAEPPLSASGGPELLDPSPWDSRSPWADPLRILRAMGEALDPLGEEGGLLALPAEPSALPFLPAALDGERPPLGPALDSLPLDEDPLTMALIAHSLPGADPITADLPLRIVLAAELDLPWLPPGFVLPLPEGLQP